MMARAADPWVLRGTSVARMASTLPGSPSALFMDGMANARWGANHCHQHGGVVSRSHAPAKHRVVAGPFALMPQPTQCSPGPGQHPDAANHGSREHEKQGVPANDVVHLVQVHGPVSQLDRPRPLVRGPSRVVRTGAGPRRRVPPRSQTIRCARGMRSDHRGRTVPAVARAPLAPPYDARGPAQPTQQGDARPKGAKKPKPEEARSSNLAPGQGHGISRYRDVGAPLPGCWQRLPVSRPVIPIPAALWGTDADGSA